MRAGSSPHSTMANIWAVCLLILGPAARRFHFIAPEQKFTFCPVLGIGVWTEKRFIARIH